MRNASILFMILCVSLSGCISDSNELPSNPSIQIESAPYDSTIVSVITLADDVPHQSVNLWLQVDNVSGFWCSSNPISEAECTIHSRDGRLVAENQDLGSICTESRCEWEVDIYYLGVLRGSEIIIQFS